MLELKYSYKNFFEWYKEEHAKWDKENPHDMYDCGISKEMFKYFILQYLYDGPITATDYDKLKDILIKYSKRYFKECLYLRFLHKEYKPKARDSFDEYLNKKYENFNTHFNDSKYNQISDEVFVEYCQLYLDGFYLSEDPISTSQYDLNSLHDILIKHSKRFKIEKYLYQLFK